MRGPAVFVKQNAKFRTGDRSEIATTVFILFTHPLVSVKKIFVLFFFPPASLDTGVKPIEG